MSWEDAYRDHAIWAEVRAASDEFAEAIAQLEGESPSVVAFRVAGRRVVRWAMGHRGCSSRNDQVTLVRIHHDDPSAPVCPTWADLRTP